MELSAIIAEYNPLHNGHVYHIQQVKKLGAPILVLMCGAFVQRGEAAVVDKYKRAEIAVSQGADIVLELPAPFCISPAEQFARGAVRLLNAISADITLCFGSECGDISMLTTTAKILANEPYELSEAIKIGLKKGLSYPTIRASAYFEYCIKHNVDIVDLSKPNNILAIEYIKAVLQTDSNIQFYTTKRTSDYHRPDADGFTSSSTLREYAYNNKLELLSNKLPSVSLEALRQAFNNKRDNSILYLSALNRLSTAEIAELYDVTEGLENRIHSSAKASGSYAQYLKTVSTARYTKSRLQRISAYALLGVTKKAFAQASTELPCFNLLACKNSIKNAILPLFNGNLCVNNYSLSTTQKAQAQLSAEAQKQFRLLNGYAMEKAIFID